MKTIFLIDGAAGTGKSDMVRYISTKKHSVATMIPKFTTRTQRAEERSLKLDLNFPEDTRDKFRKRTKSENFYWYTYGNKKLGEEYYGFYKVNIEEALNQFDFVLIIVRDHETICRIKKDFRDIRVVSVFIYSDRDLVIQRMKIDGYSQGDIKRRLERHPLAWFDYLKFSKDYDEVIINSSKHEDYERLLEGLFAKYGTTLSDIIEITPRHTYPLVKPLIGFKQGIVKKIAKYPFHKNVFLMMKFRDGKNSLIYKYIKKTLATYDLNCVRADEAVWDITRNAYNPVAVLYCCKYGIALFDNPEPGNDYSPNVAYELGIMQNQGKDCLILKSATIKKVPFDLVKELYVEYRDNLELEAIVEGWISKIQDH